MKWFFKVLKQYANFKGRASREEFWMFFLFNLLVTFALTVIGIGLWMWSNKTGVIFLPCLYQMAVLIPSFAVTIRRLHDTGRNAWFLLVNLIPVIGGLWLFIVLVIKGVSEENRFGKNNPTAYESRYHRKRSAAVALIIASIFWFFTLIIFLIFQSGGNESQLLSIFLPLGLIITGYLLFSKRMFSIGVAWSLIVFSVVWLFRDILLIHDAYSLLTESFNIPLFISLLVILVPLALLLSGIYILIMKTDRTIPVCLLFAGSFVWILSILLNVIKFPRLPGDSSDYLMLLNNFITMVVPVSLMVLARTFLSKEKFAKEAEPVLPVIEQKVKPAAKPVIEQKLKPTAKPVIEQKMKPAVKPVIEQKVQPAAKPVIEQKVQPAVKPNPVGQPVVSENRKKVDFLREDTDNNNIWRIYQAPSKVDAMAFLSKITINRPSFFVVVETPEGNFGRDKDGFYQE